MGTAFDPDRPFNEAGADSLGMIRLMYEAGRRIDRTLPLDIITLRMTPRQLAVRLSHLLPAMDLDDRPVLFLLTSAAAAPGEMAPLCLALAVQPADDA